MDGAEQPAGRRREGPRTRHLWDALGEPAGILLQAAEVRGGQGPGCVQPAANLSEQSR